MGGVNILSIMNMLRRIRKSHEKYFKNYRKYASLVKSIMEKELGSDVKVFLFGSMVEGKAIPGASDIDVLVVSKRVPRTVTEQSRLRSKFLLAINDLSAPFEIHFMDPTQFKSHKKLLGKLEEV